MKSLYYIQGIELQDKVVHYVIGNKHLEITAWIASNRGYNINHVLMRKYMCNDNVTIEDMKQIYLTASSLITTSRKTRQYFYTRISSWLI